MISRSLILTALLGSTLLATIGCSRSEPNKPSTADTTATLEGRAVSKPNQLVGIWMAVSDGQLSGVEFLKGDQAMLTSIAGSTLTLAYTVLDDGRLSLVNPQGQTTVYTTTLSGDTLELATEQVRPGTQRFRRLPKGQTLTEGIKAHETQMVEQMQKRILALQAMLLKGDVVLTSDEEQDGWVMAMRFNDPQNMLDGEMIFDTIRGQTNALSPVLVIPFRAETGAADRRSDLINIQIRTDAVSEPAGQEKVSGTVRLTMSGEPEAQRIEGPAVFSSLSPTPRQVTLRNDPAAFKATIDKLDAQREARRIELDRMAQFLGGRSVFSGQRTATGNPDSEPVRLLVERNEQDNGYQAVVTTGNRVDQPAQAGVDLLMGQAALYVVMPWGEQWRLQTGKTVGTLQGLWRPRANTDFISHGGVDLTLEEHLSQQQLAEERAAIQRYLTEGMRTAQRFVGFVERRYGATNITRWPVSIEMQAAGDNTVTATAWLIAQRGGVTLTGTRDQRNINLTAASVIDGSADIRSYQTQRWQLELAGITPEPTFVADVIAGSMGGGRVVLSPANDQNLAQRREQLTQALNGIRYAAATTDTSSNRDKQTFFSFSTDPDTGDITADVLGDGSMWTMVPPGRFTGQIVDDHAFPVLKGTLVPAPDPDYGGGRDGKPIDIAFCAVETDDGVYLTGYTLPERGNQDWLLLSPLAPGDEIVMDEVKRIRLAALKLGASAQPPTDPVPGDQAVVIISVTDRDARAGQLFYADGKYTHRNSIAAAAIHSGLAQPGETCVLRLTYGQPFTSVVESVEQNGVTSSRGTFRENNPLPTFTIERLTIE